MNRYQMAVAKINPSKPPETEFRLRASSSLRVVKSAIAEAAAKRLTLIGDQIDRGLLDRAVIGVSYDSGVPILVANRREAISLHIAYNYNNIFPAFPAGEAQIREYIIYGNDFEIPAGIHIWGIVKR